MNSVPLPAFRDNPPSVLSALNERFMQWTVEEPPTPPLPVEELDTDFKRAFPPDPFGQEAADTARVWKVYRAHATAHDDALLTGWNASLDALLIFAGLFSAVATAFFVESYRTLQFDNDGLIVNALYALVVLQNATGTAPTLPLPPPVTSSPSLTAHRINGLWFTSLILALAVTFLSILVKQWLRQYSARNTASTASPRQWAHRRQYLYDALVAYGVSDIISVLPLLLHVALFLFLAGSILFLWDLDRFIAIFVMALTSILGLIYVVSIGIPLRRPECPMSTPLVGVIRRATNSLPTALIYVQSLSYRFGDALKALFGNSSAHARILQLPPSRPTAAYLELDLRGSSARSNEFAARRTRVGADNLMPPMYNAMANPESIPDHVQRREDELDGLALLWMIRQVPDSDAVAATFQAIGALRPSSGAVKSLRLHDVVTITPTTFPGLLFTHSPAETGGTEWARALKTWTLIQHQQPSGRFRHIVMPASTDVGLYPDLALLAKAAFMSPKFILHQPLALTATSTSTIMVLLHTYRSSYLPLLRYCDFSSSAMDWDTVISATADMYSSDGRSPTLERNMPEAARVCVALASALSRERVDADGDLSYRDAIAEGAVRLMHFVSPTRLDADGLFSTSRSAGAVYGSGFTHLLSFFDSPAFPIDNRKALSSALAILLSTTHCNWFKPFQPADLGMARQPMRVGMSLLLRATPSSCPVAFPHGVLLFAAALPRGRTDDASQIANLLSLFLLPHSRYPLQTTVYKELWKFVETTEFVAVLSIIAEQVVKCRPVSFRLQPDLEAAFLADMRFLDILRAFATDDCAVLLRDPDSHYSKLVTISIAYRTLDESKWLEDVTAAVHSTDDRVCAFASELQKATNEATAQS